nr:hypothetical protein [Tanacetum cinerariifolium]
MGDHHHKPGTTRREIGRFIGSTAAVVANPPPKAHYGGNVWKSRRCCCGAGGGGRFVRGSGGWWRCMVEVAAVMRVRVVTVAAMATVVAAGVWCQLCRGRKEGGEWRLWWWRQRGEVAAALVVPTAGGGAWRWWMVDLIDRATGRHFWGSPEKFAGKLFRRRQSAGDGGRRWWWPACGWRGGRE